MDPKHSNPESDAAPRLLCLRVKTWYLVCVLLWVGTFGMQLGALGAPRWASYKSPERNYQYALRLCTDGDGDDAREGTSWSCLKAQTCREGGWPGMCRTAEDMVYSFKTYWVLELFALLWVLLILVRLIALYRQKDHGPSWMLYVLLAAGILTHCAAIMAWFALTNANFMDDCTVRTDNPHNRPDVCAEEGAKLSIATIFAFFLSTLLTIIVLVKDSNKVVNERLPSGKFKGMSYTIWLVLTFIFMLSGLFLVIASGAVRDWIKTNDLRGTILTYDSWKGLEDQDYDCISEPICTADTDQGACETFRAIKRSTQAYLFFIVAVFFAWAVWADGWLMLVLRRNYSIPAFYLALAHLTWFLQLTGMVVFFGVSQANFVTTCTHRNDTEKWDICAGDGPILAIVGTLVLFVAGLLFTFVFLGRNQVKGLPEEVPQSGGQDIPLQVMDSERVPEEGGQIH